tara:strand:+ start:24157 stop:25623 length:1467 start_codon:yes stop_codon:yes gene_type:complete
MNQDQLRNMSLEDLLGNIPREYRNINVNDIVLDSRQVKPGTAFFALRGSKQHGLDYKDEALARGATAIIYDSDSYDGDIAGPVISIPKLGNKIGRYANIFYKKKSNLNLVGVTGTNGKSSVAYISSLARINSGYKCGYIGTIGKGIPPNLLKETSLTTPDCFSLHKQISDLDVDNLIMEVSSHALSQNRIDGLDFQVAVFTNLSHDHLDYHVTYDAYEIAKLSLFQIPTLKKAVVFLDDDFSNKVIKKIPKGVEVISTSLKSGADITGRIISCDINGIVMDVSDSESNATINSPLLGDFNAENLIISLGILKSLGASLIEASRLLSLCPGVIGRMHSFGGDKEKPLVVIDYAHSPASIEKALRFLSRNKKGSLWCVFGCGGARDSSKRKEMGNIVASIADHIILTDDNPRNEDPNKIISDISSGIKNHPSLLIERDRFSAISNAISSARKEDTILIAGKGDEEKQYLAKETIDFSDLSEVQKALGALN